MLTFRCVWDVDIKSGSEKELVPRMPEDSCILISTIGSLR